MLKIKRLNCDGEEVESVIDETKIDGLSERKVASTPLFDGCGNKVSEQEHESVYDVYFDNGRQISVTKATYDSLVAKLKIETL